MSIILGTSSFSFLLVGHNCGLFSSLILRWASCSLPPRRVVQGSVRDSGRVFRQFEFPLYCSLLSWVISLQFPIDIVAPNCVLGFLMQARLHISIQIPADLEKPPKWKTLSVHFFSFRCPLSSKTVYF